MNHSTIALHPASCTSCMLCVRECPDWCITVQAHSEPDPDAPAYSNSRRQATKNVLDQFTIDFGQCMWCGICIDVCPGKAEVNLSTALKHWLLRYQAQDEAMDQQRHK
jgi:NADH-quinone oxidoreductase subunit I